MPVGHDTRIYPFCSFSTNIVCIGRSADCLLVKQVKFRQLGVIAVPDLGQRLGPVIARVARVAAWRDYQSAGFL